MEAARRVLERLERIDALLETGAGRVALLPELRALLVEGEAWAAAEGAGTERAAASLAGLRRALETRGSGDGTVAGEEVAAPGSRL